MTREELKALGLTDEQVESVMKSHGKATNSIKEEADKVEGLESQIADYKGQLAERDTQLETLSKVDAEGLQAEIDRLKDENEATATEFQGKLDKQSFEFALEKAIVATGARNPKAVKALLDVDSIKLDGDKLLGLDTQVEALKESDDYLFGTEEAAGLKGRQPNNPPNIPGGTKNPWSKEHLNLTEQGRILREDPELAKQLQGQK